MSRLAQFQDQVQNGFGYEEFQPIPNGVEVLCFVESAAWEKLLNTRVKPAAHDEFIKVKYRVVGGEYDNRVIFQKLHILGKVENTPEKNVTTEENALLMLAALDQICLGGAMSRLPHDPEDEDLIKLQGKKVLVTPGINRFKNQFNEDQATNFVRSLQPVPTQQRPANTEAGADGGATRERRQRRAR